MREPMMLVTRFHQTAFLDITASGRFLSSSCQRTLVVCLRPLLVSVPQDHCVLICTAGLRISEALALRFDDITPDGLLICKTKFHKERLVPLHQTAVDGLEHYLIRRRRVGGADNHVFISLRGQGVRYYTVYETFRSLVKVLKLEPKTGQSRPNFHGLRHTFAVRALEDGPQGRDRISRHMLALSTYLGHARVTDTYWYLEATSQLMVDIADACERFMKGDKP
jgi:integrase